MRRVFRLLLTWLRAFLPQPLVSKTVDRLPWEENGVWCAVVEGVTYRSELGIRWFDETSFELDYETSCQLETYVAAGKLWRP